MTLKQPLLQIGNFGTHITKNPAGTFSFVGHVPTTCNNVYKTYEEAENAFIEFFRKQDISWQKENISNLRNDIFVKILSI